MHGARAELPAAVAARRRQVGDGGYQAAADAGLPCRSLLGTQIAPEDVSGIPRIVGERSVFCPPRILLPEQPEPFCLFLDELPACAPDVQKAFYSLLLERRLGEHTLPPGTWVVAAGNRMQDRALVRSMSSALVNRVTILHLRVDVDEWQAWAASKRRARRRAQLHRLHARRPDAAGAGRAGAVLDPARLGAAVARARPRRRRRHPHPREQARTGVRPAVGGGRRGVLRARRGADRRHAPDRGVHLPSRPAARHRRRALVHPRLHPPARARRAAFAPRAAHGRHGSWARLQPEQQLTLVSDLVEQWGALGADRAMFDLLQKVTAI